MSKSTNNVLSENLSNETEPLVNDEELKLKLELNYKIQKEIRELTTKLATLKKDFKTNNVFIFKNCKHNWILDKQYFAYDERPNICTKCNMVRN